MLGCITRFHIVTRWHSNQQFCVPFSVQNWEKNCVQTKATSLGPKVKDTTQVPLVDSTLSFFGGCQKKNVTENLEKCEDPEVFDSTNLEIKRFHGTDRAAGACFVQQQKKGNIKPYRIDVRCVFERSHFEMSNEQKKIVVVWVMLGTRILRGRV